jgi:hypothetical protein
MTKLRRFTVVVASVMAAAVMGVPGAGAAPAGQPAAHIMCVQPPAGGDECAVAPARDGNLIMMSEIPTGIWSWSRGAWNEIQEGSQCMQLDHNDGNAIVLAVCNGRSYQEWQAIGGNELRSHWNGSLCLTYNAQGGDLDAISCNHNGNHPWYQAWISLGNFPASRRAATW